MRTENIFKCNCALPTLTAKCGIKIDLLSTQRRHTKSEPNAEWLRFWGHIEDIMAQLEALSPWPVSDDDDDNDDAPSPDHRITGYPRQQDSNDPATPLSAFQFQGMYLFGRLSVNLRSGNLLSLLLCAYNAPKCDHNK